MYATKTDIGKTGKPAYYTGLLEYIDQSKATFRFSTWIEPPVDKRYGRETRILRLDEILEMIASETDPKDQREEFESSIKVE